MSMQTAAAAHAGLLALMRERRGRGLDLEALLELRHLSRTCAFHCSAPGCAERSMELEQRAKDLYAVTGRQSPGELALLERRIDKLLGQLEAGFAQRAA